MIPRPKMHNCQEHGNHRYTVIEWCHGELTFGIFPLVFDNVFALTFNFPPVFMCRLVILMAY